LHRGSEVEQSQLCVYCDKGDGRHCTLVRVPLAYFQRLALSDQAVAKGLRLHNQGNIPSQHHFPLFLFASGFMMLFSKEPNVLKIAVLGGAQPGKTCFIDMVPSLSVNNTH
jgi:hypothetical protein